MPMIPRIELDLGAFTHQHLITKLDAPITSTHDLGYLQPTGEQVMSRQDWTERCPASKSTSATNCPTPQARAYDHHDKEVEVTQRIFLVDMDNDVVNKEVDDVDYAVRSTYLFKYDAKDSAGNHAEQVVFALILDDKNAPTIQPCLGVAETVEAASDWKLCGDSKATDKLDGDVSASIRYTIEAPNGMTLCTNAVHSVAQRYIDTTEVGKFNVHISAHDNAGAYGVDGRDNSDSVTKVVNVEDTRKPWIVVLGEDPLDHECGTTFTDIGATAHDLLDTEKLHKTLEVQVTNPVDSMKVDDYKVRYDAKDTAGNLAVQATRDVKVLDTTPPVMKLIGDPQIVHHSQTEGGFDDPGVTQTDQCDVGISARTATATWDREFDDRKLGDYTRTYSITDAEGLTSTITRTVTIVDSTAPTIQITDPEGSRIHEAVPDGVYTDPGATCHDYVQGDISNAVVTTGDDVNLAVPGTYKIHYNCKDASDNAAEQLTRTVIVEDRTCPRITRTGAAVIHVEAGFPYEDEGATASDSLDGDISNKVTSDGDTVNESVHWVAARSCAEIKEGMRKQDVIPKDGDYFITTRAEKRVKVWCDMASGNTYYKCDECSWVQPYTGETTTMAGDCTKHGLEMAWWPSTVSGDAAKKKAERKFKGAVSYFPIDAEAQTNYYLCMARALHTHNPFLGDAIHHEQIAQAEAGKYVIEYHVQDKAGNPECEEVKRTVIVKDTLPPVISLHMLHKDGTHSTAFHVGKGDQTGIGGVTNPAGDENVNPNLAPWVDGEGKTHHAVAHPSANNVNYVIGRMPKEIDEIANPYSLMAEQSSTLVNGWVVAAAASAVAGVALLVSSSRKAVATSVPV